VTGMKDSPSLIAVGLIDDDRNAVRISEALGDLYTDGAGLVDNGGVRGGSGASFLFVSVSPLLAETDTSCYQEHQEV